MESVDIERLVECEFERFTPNFYRGRADAPDFELLEGSAAVLISAPHAVTHARRGKVKPSEDFTGSIALAVARAAGCHAIVATRTGSGDPNWDPLEECPYKQALCTRVRESGIRFVLDLHGMVAASEALVALGSADGETVAAAPGLDNRVADLLRQRLSPWTSRYGKPVVLNGRLGARGENTIARTVARECGVPALQLEAATQMRVPARFGRRAPQGERIPKGERIPFSGAQLPIEIAARKAADPAAVSALVNALVEVMGIIENDAEKASRSTF